MSEGGRGDRETRPYLESVVEELESLPLEGGDLVVVQELLLAELEDPADKVKVALALLPYERDVL